jgi:hypothetical protein
VRSDRAGHRGGHRLILGAGRAGRPGHRGRLGLQLDRYRYLVGTQRSGPQTAALTLRCEVRGPHMPPPAGLPPITDRAGIDVNPIDLQDQAARAWLLACAPPEASARCPGAAAASGKRLQSRPAAQAAAGDESAAAAHRPCSTPAEQLALLPDLQAPPPGADTPGAQVPDPASPPGSSAGTAPYPRRYPARSWSRRPSPWPHLAA